ncbi:hypothetical protein T484DRAFT_1752870 [Baffinella frigidus]|nr:hypothetical protein T484DRAFT_1752870 [Cryptophyta sp. CCMP2293]
MREGQVPLPPQDGATVTFRCLPSLPPRASSLKSVPQVRKPSFRPSRALKSMLENSSDSSSDSEPPRFFGDWAQGSRVVAAHVVSTTSGGKHTLVRGGLAQTPTVHRVLATRYKWRTACAKALSGENSPEELFDAAMKPRGAILETLPAGKYDAARPPSRGPLLSHVSSTSLSRPSLLSMPSATSPAAMRWLSSPDLGTARRGTANLTYRGTERSTLVRSRSPHTRSLPAKSSSTWALEGEAQLPGQLRCALRHAPRAAARAAQSEPTEDDEEDDEYEDEDEDEDY